MADRTDYILEKLDQDGFLNVNDLASELGVSSATIRRDFMALEEDGKLRRVAGGAIPVPENSLATLESDQDVEHKIYLNSAAKHKACEMAAELVADGDCVFIDGGTTTASLFNLLQDRRITIVTNNILLVAAIELPVTASFILIGGTYMPEHALTYSSTAYTQIQSYNFNHCFIACAGVDVGRNYSYCTETETRDFKLLALQQSMHKHLLIDSSKFGKVGFCNLERLDRFDTVFVDKRAADAAEYPANFRFFEA